MIQRYETPVWTDKGTYVYYELCKGENGSYVLYADHLAAIAEKDKEIAHLKDIIEEKKNEIDNLKDVYIHQLRCALGYPVPGDIPPNPNILNGIADALQIQLAEKMSKEDSDGRGEETA